MGIQTLSALIYLKSEQSLDPLQAKGLNHVPLTTTELHRAVLTFETPEMINVLRLVGVFRATLDADSVSWRMAVSATGSSPLERRLLSEQQKHRYLAQR